MLLCHINFSLLSPHGCQSSLVFLPWCRSILNLPSRVCQYDLWKGIKWNNYTKSNFLNKFYFTNKNCPPGNNDRAYHFIKCYFTFSCRDKARSSQGPPTVIPKRLKFYTRLVMRVDPYTLQERHFQFPQNRGKYSATSIGQIAFIHSY